MIKASVTSLLLFACCAQATVQQMSEPLTPSDTTTVQALRDSSYEYSYSNPDRAIEFANRALEIANQINYQEGIAGAHGDLGYAYSVKGEFETALNHLDEGISLSRSIDDSLGWVSMLNYKGSIYKSKSEYNKALELYFKTRELCIEMGLERGIASTLTNIGFCYYELKEHDKALEFYQWALKINERLDNKTSLAVIYNNLGLVHGDEGNYDQALEYHSKPLELREELEYPLEIANSLNSIGKLHMQQGQNEIAIDHFNQAFKVNDGQNQDLSSVIHENLTKLYTADDQYDQALFHAKETLALSKAYGTKLGEKVGYELLAEIYEQTGEFEKAYINQQKLTAVKAGKHGKLQFKPG